MTLDYNRIAFALAVVVISVLVALGKLPAATLAFLVGHLLPSPATPTGGAS